MGSSAKCGHSRRTSAVGSRSHNQAQALADNPGVLTHGRSPASRGVGALLIALRRAGATQVSPPRCTDCGKPLRTLQRRGEDWFCSLRGAPAQAALRGLRRGEESQPPGIGGASLGASSVPTTTTVTRWSCSPR
jgi:hypothetical protein